MLIYDALGGMRKLTRVRVFARREHVAWAAWVADPGGGSA